MELAAQACIEFRNNLSVIWAKVRESTLPPHDAMPLRSQVVVEDLPSLKRERPLEFVVVHSAMPAIVERAGGDAQQRCFVWYRSGPLVRSD